MFTPRGDFALYIYYHFVTLIKYLRNLFHRNLAFVYLDYYNLGILL